MTCSSTPISRVFLSKWLLIPLGLLISARVLHFIFWVAAYYWEYWTTPQLSGIHLLPDRQRWGVLDNVIEELFRPTHAIDPKRITLILHMSADYLSEDIAEQFHNWAGPIALTIVLNDVYQLECAVVFMRSLIAKNGFGMKQSEWTLDDLRKKGNDRKDCSIPSRTRSLVEIADYPMNMARNIARQHVKTKFILLSDVDLLFSEGFERRMAEVANRELHSDEKKVIVFRIFEIYKQKSMPRTKAEMAELMDNGQADVFHVVSAPGHHDLEGRADWFARPENFTHTNVVPGRIRYTRYTWEPRFVGLSSVPLHDEAFPYRIRANNVLGWEMCRAGYEFVLVEDLFTFHRAKRVSDYGRQSENNLIQLMNRLRYEHAFARWFRRMDEEYPDTKRTCPAILKNTLWFYTEE